MLVPRDQVYTDVDIHVSSLSMIETAAVNVLSITHTKFFGQPRHVPAKANSMQLVK